MSPRSTRIVRRSTAVRAPKRFVNCSVCSAVSDIRSLYFHQQGPMVHAADSGVAQDFDPTDIFKISWTKNVIDAAIVDGSVAGTASEIAKRAQDVTVRFAVVFQIVGIKIGFVRGFQFKVKVTGDKNARYVRDRLCPINQLLRVRPAARGIEGIGMGAYEDNLMYSEC